MKKIFCLFTGIILIFVLCSCSAGVKIPDVVTNINGKAVVEYGNQKYECNISRLTDGIISITVNSPKNLSGLTFRHAGGKYSVSYGELMCRADSILLPKNSFPTMIINILSAANIQENLIYQSTDNDMSTFSGNSDTGSFLIITDKKGNIKEILQDSSGLKVKINDNFASENSNL